MSVWTDTWQWHCAHQRHCLELNRCVCGHDRRRDEDFDAQVRRAMEKHPEQSNPQEQSMDIKGISKAKILAALYNASRPQGMGFLQATPGDMTEVEAQKLLDDGQTRFDYLRGGVMKIDLSGDELRTALYDRDNGQGAAEDAITRAIASA